jgi:hypothetical protein
MKLFKCQSCQQVLYFENTVGVKSGHRLGYIPETATLSALEPAGDTWRALATPGDLFRFCGHETGHYFWDRLVRDRGRLDACRALFGDVRQDYAQALQTYYNNGAPSDWQSRFVSMYATSHLWEDFAQTWAHYLHIVDTLEIARAFGLSTHPTLTRGGELAASAEFDPYRAPGMGPLIDSWLPLSLALNSLNRAMGLPDLYPFVLSPPAIDKLGFVHELVHAV